jgi:hypothetical protein
MHEIKAESLQVGVSTLCARSNGNFLMYLMDARAF